jgi:hypothetical protein
MDRKTYNITPPVAQSSRVREARNKRKNLADDYEDDIDDSSSQESNRFPKPTAKRSLGRPKLPLGDVAMQRTGSSAISRGDPNRKCEVCSATETPQWRRGPSGKRALCNACGVKWSSGRLILNAPPGSPFPFTTTESENLESSDASGFEEVEVGSSSWKLQLEVSRLKSKLREVERSHRRLLKLVQEGAMADKQVDRSYRRLITISKKSLAKSYSPVKTRELQDLFFKSDYTEDIDDPQCHVRYGDSTEKERILETNCISNFISAVKDF